MVLLAEYADDNDGALSLLAAAEVDWPGDPRLRRERTKILFRLGRHAEVTFESDEILASMDIADLIERAHTIRLLGLSAVVSGNLSKGVDLLGEAELAARGARSMQDLAVGLSADRAFVLWRTGDRAGALEITTC